MWKLVTVLAVLIAVTALVVACVCYVYRSKRGYRGYTGPAGVAGSATNTGATGAIGATGATGAVGPQGLDGDATSTGATGYTGATGPEGASSAVSFAYVYNTEAQTVGENADILFSHSSLITPDFEFTNGQAHATMLTDGSVDVEFAVVSQPGHEVAVCVNGVPVPGSIYSNGRGSAFFEAAAGSTISLRNQTVGNELNLTSTGPNTSNAYMRIIQWRTM